MKPTALSLAIAAVAFGASTLYLSLQLRDERAQSDKLIAETRALEARIAELENFRAERYAAVNPFSPSMLPPALRSAQEVRTEETTGPGDDFGESVAINTPRNEEFFRKMMRSQVRAHNKRQYAEVGPLLGLSKDETSKLIDLLTQQQVDGGVSVSGPLDTENVLRQMAEKQRENKAQIADLIGADKADTLEEYQESLPARQELEMLTRQFDGADAPLSDEQQKRLLEILLEERKRVPAPKMTDATSLDEHWNAYTAWQNSYEERVTSQVRAVLNSAQLSTYNEYQEWQTQMRPEVGVVHSGRALPVPGGPSVIFSTAAPAMSADVAIAAPPPEKPRK
jgi:hypothetical protein